MISIWIDIDLGLVTAPSINALLILIYWTFQACLANKVISIDLHILYSDWFNCMKIKSMENRRLYIFKNLLTHMSCLYIWMHKYRQRVNGLSICLSVCLLVWLAGCMYLSNQALGYWSKKKKTRAYILLRTRSVVSSIKIQLNLRATIPKWIKFSENQYVGYEYRSSDHVYICIYIFLSMQMYTLTKTHPPLISHETVY